MFAMTGDRPTGPLHIGHYLGSLKNRVALQHTHQLTVLIADYQALTDNVGQSEKIRSNIIELMKDYLAVGLDPNKVTFVLQSAVPELFSLTCYLQNLVTLNKLKRNPTIRNELVSRGFEQNIPVGFFCYPISQAADIIGLNAGVIPVGDDQLPMIELCNDVVSQLNQLGGNFSLCRAMLSQTTRLNGFNGKGKMSKSAGNSIPLGCTEHELNHFIKQAYTDPNHLKVSDPGTVEGNIVFEYLDAFDSNTDELKALKEQYRKGGLGDMVLKRRLMQVMNTELEPIRDKRHTLNDCDVLDILREGTRTAQQMVQHNLQRVEETLGVFRL